MKTPDLYASLLNLLSTQELTSDQLLGQLNAFLKSTGQAQERAIRVRRALTALLYLGKLERTIDDRKIARFRLPEAPRYSFEIGTGITAGWRLLRNDPGENCTHILGQGMTEAEARVCVAALNEHDRKVRALASRK